MNRRQPKHRPKLGAMSVSLLNELLADPLDRGYREAAERARTGHGMPRSRLLHRSQIVVGLLLVGLVWGTAYQQARREEPVSSRVKLALIQDIHNRGATGQQLQRQAQELAQEVARERNTVLAATSEGQAAQRRLELLEIQTGAISVTGSGVVVTVGDAAPADQAGPLTGQQQLTGEQQTATTSDAGRITDRDLQLLVNELWAAGAEAISVGGMRLTPTTTIREAGEAILVDFAPVTSPYLIRAVGDPNRLLPRFADSRVGQQYQTYVGVYGIRFDIARADTLTLPAAPGTDLKYARPEASATPAAPTSTSTPGTGRATGTPSDAPPTGGNS